MTMVNLPLNQLREIAFASVEECRQRINEGRSDLSGLERSVRDYCTAIARLPKAEGQEHEEALQALMREVESLSAELEGAREAIRNELAGLGRIKQANVAYHKSYAVGPVTVPKNEDD